MTAHPESDDTRDRIQALVTVWVLAVASLLIAFLGAVPAGVSATELMDVEWQDTIAAGVDGIDG